MTVRLIESEQLPDDTPGWPLARLPSVSVYHSVKLPRRPVLRVGIAVLPTHRSIDPAVLAARAEELGFESLWAPEQPTLPVETVRDIPRAWGDIVDPFVMLARASATTSTLMLGTAVVVVPEHSPILLAKRAATLDALSGGRLLFGIGVGSVPEEAALFGTDFPRRWTQARRGRGRDEGAVDPGAELSTTAPTTTSRPCTATRSRPGSRIRRCCWAPGPPRRFGVSSSGATDGSP